MGGMMSSYITLEQSIRLDAKRHWTRGYIHSLLGRYAYAAGSYRKAIKFETKASSIEAMKNGIFSRRVA
jgi:hypothetical protein